MVQIQITRVKQNRECQTDIEADADKPWYKRGNKEVEELLVGVCTKTCFNPSSQWWWIQREKLNISNSEQKLTIHLT